MRSDGIDTSKIIDIQFVGKSMTVFLIPEAYREELVLKINALEKFVVKDTFDPLDTSYMKSLPQYQGKSEEELLRIAIEKAKARIARYINSIPESRTGTRKYYKMMQKKLNDRIGN
jgi:hypothetical protein